MVLQKKSKKASILVTAHSEGIQVDALALWIPSPNAIFKITPGDVKLFLFHVQVRHKRRVHTALQHYSTIIAKDKWLIKKQNWHTVCALHLIIAIYW